MTTTDQILAMMRDEATKNFTEGKTTAKWTEANEAQFRFYMDFYSEEVRLKILADKEGQEKFGWFGLVMMKCYFPLGGKEEEKEVYGVCEECGKEGKFIGEEGDDWTCEECSNIAGFNHSSDEDSDDGKIACCGCRKLFYDDFMLNTRYNDWYCENCWEDVPKELHPYIEGLDEDQDTDGSDEDLNGAISVSGSAF